MIDTNKENTGTVWHVFVSRLRSDTTADDITDFLYDSGINVVNCETLDPKEKWQRKSAAFHIQVDSQCQDAVFTNRGERSKCDSNSNELQGQNRLRV